MTSDNSNKKHECSKRHENIHKAEAKRKTNWSEADDRSKMRRRRQDITVERPGRTTIAAEVSDAGLVSWWRLWGTG